MGVRFSERADISSLVVCSQLSCRLPILLSNGHKYMEPNIHSPHTYLLIPRCRVLLEKLTGLQLVKKFPAFNVTRRFITALTSVRHLSLSWASPIQSTCPHPTSWRSILILSTHLRLGLPSEHSDVTYIMSGPDTLGSKFASWLR